MRQGGRSGTGAGGAVFIRNGTFDATYSTFSGDTVTNSVNTLDGSEVYLLADGNVAPFDAMLVDDILGQSGASVVSDFYTGVNNSGTSYDLLGIANDLVTNNPGAGSGLVGPAVIGGDPMLGPLSNNGGPTQTMAPLTGSPVLAVGIEAYFNPPSNTQAIMTDQRGVFRSIAAPNLGAFEANTNPQWTFITVSPGSLPLGTVPTGTAGSTNDYTVSGSNLVTAVTITAPAGVQISDDSGATWNTSLSENPAAGRTVESNDRGANRPDGKCRRHRRFDHKHRRWRDGTGCRCDRHRRAGDHGQPVDSAVCDGRHRLQPAARRRRRFGKWIQLYRDRLTPWTHTDSGRPLVRHADDQFGIAVFCGRHRFRQQ